MFITFIVSKFCTLLFIKKISDIKGYFFNCEYKIKIRTNLDSKLITTKKTDIPLEVYVSEEYFNKKNEKLIQEKEENNK